MTEIDPEHTADWDRSAHGRMADYAAPDDAVETATGGDETGEVPDAS